MMSRNFGLNPAGLSVHTIRAARRVIDWTWIMPEETPAAGEEEPAAPTGQTCETDSEIADDGFNHAA